jgi:hypothetical protein
MQTLARSGALLAVALVFGACGASDRAEDIKPVNGTLTATLCE